MSTPKQRILNIIRQVRNLELNSIGAINQIEDVLDDNPNARIYVGPPVVAWLGLVVCALFAGGLLGWAIRCIDTNDQYLISQAKRTAAETSMLERISSSNAENYKAPKGEKRGK